MPNPSTPEQSKKVPELPGAPDTYFVKEDYFDRIHKAISKIAKIANNFQLEHNKFLQIFKDTLFPELDRITQQQLIFFNQEIHGKSSALNIALENAEIAKENAKSSAEIVSKNTNQNLCEKLNTIADKSIENSSKANNAVISSAKNLASAKICYFLALSETALTKYFIKEIPIEIAFELITNCYSLKDKINNVIDTEFEIIAKSGHYIDTSILYQEVESSGNALFDMIDEKIIPYIEKTLNNSITHPSSYTISAPEIIFQSMGDEEDIYDFNETIDEVEQVFYAEDQQYTSVIITGEDQEKQVMDMYL